MIDVMMGFDKEQAAQVRERLEHNDELLIYPSSISPQAHCIGRGRSVGML